MVLVVARGTEVVAAQLGDGDVVVAPSLGVARRPVPGDARNVGNITTSLCLPDAAKSFRFADLALQGQPPELVLVSSDGYANSFRDANWPAAVVDDLVDALAASGVGAVESALPGWAAESARVGGDDVSIIVAVRRDTLAGLAQRPRPAAGLRPPSPPVTAGAAGAAAPRPAGSPAGRAWPLALAAAAVAVVVGFALGWLLHRSDGDGATAATTLAPGPTVATTAVPPDWLPVAGKGFFVIADPADLTQSSKWTRPAPSPRRGSS